MDFAGDPTSGRFQTLLDKKVASFLRKFQAETRACWARSAQLRARNVDPSSDADVVRMCSNLHEACSVRSVTQGTWV